MILAKRSTSFHNLTHDRYLHHAASYSQCLQSARQGSQLPSLCRIHLPGTQCVTPVHFFWSEFFLHVRSGCAYCPGTIAGNTVFLLRMTKFVSGVFRIHDVVENNV
jgi:hypothetical protein